MRVGVPNHRIIRISIVVAWLVLRLALAPGAARAAIVPPLDHFQCYEAHAPRHLISAVALVDALGASTVDLLQPHRFCAPADKNGEDPTAPSHPVHLEGFRMRQTSPRFARVRDVQVANQFGTVVVDLVRPDYLLVPSSKSLVAPPPPLASVTVDHFKCYLAHGQQRERGLGVQDQFGALTLDLKRPERLCLAADKNGEGTVDAGASLLCYEIRMPGGAASVPPGQIFLTNQFGNDAFSLFRATELCVPSLVTIAPPTATATTTPSIATATSTPVVTPSAVATPSPSPSATPPATATDIPTPTATATAVETPTPSATATLVATPTPSETASATASPTPTDTPAAVATDTPTGTPSATTTPLETATPTAVETPTPTDGATPSATPTPAACGFDGQQCSGDCPVGEECDQLDATTCACVAIPLCGFDVGAGQCGGACSDPNDLCLFVPNDPQNPFVGTCGCVPPAQACSGDGETCSGLCPTPGDQCAPSTVVLGTCDCRAIL